MQSSINMEDLRLEEDEYLSFWVTNNAGIERLALDSPGDKSKNAQSPADDAGPGNENDQDLNNHGLGIEFHDDATEKENKGFPIPAGVNPVTEKENVQVPVKPGTVSDDRGGVPVESAAPEGPMTREEIIFKWLSGLKDDPHPLFSVDDRSPHELDWEAGDTVPQGWARTRPATGVPRQIPNYRFFDYTSGTYTDLHGAPPPV